MAKLHFRAAWAVILLVATGARGDLIESVYLFDGGDPVWENADNWLNSPDQGGYPNNDDQNTYIATVGGGVSLSSMVTITGLDLVSSGGITGSGTLTVQGSATQAGSGSGFAGGSGVATLNTLQVNGGFLISGWTVNANQIDVGTEVVNGGITLGPNAQLNIDGVLAFNRDGGVSVTGDDSGVLEVFGTLGKYFGPFGIQSFSDIGAKFECSGCTIFAGGGGFRFPTAVQGQDWRVNLAGATLVAQSGDIVFLRDAEWTGVTAMAEPGFRILLFAGEHDFTGSLDLTDGGYFRLQGSASVAGALSSGDGAFVIDGGVLGGHGLATIENGVRVRFDKGTIGVVVNEGELETFAAAGGRTISGVLDNDGAFRIDHTVGLAANACIEQSADSFIELGEAGKITDLSGAGDIGALDPAGRIVKTDDTSGLIAVPAKFTGENGGFSVTAGTLTLTGPADQTHLEFSSPTIHEITGTLAINTNAMVEAAPLFAFTNGEVEATRTLTISGETELTTNGTGAFRIDGVNAAVNGGVLMGGANAPVQFESGLLGDETTVTNRGQFNWCGGEMRGFRNEADGAQAATATCPGAAPRLVGSGDPIAFRNAGEFLQFDPIIFTAGGVIEQESGAVWTTAADLDVQAPLDGAFINGSGATFRRVVDGVNFIRCKFSNLGTVESTAGSLAFFSDTISQVDEATKTLTGGTWCASGTGVVNLNADIEVLGAGATIKVKGPDAAVLPVDQITRVDGTLDIEDGADADYVQPKLQIGQAGQVRAKGVLADAGGQTDVSFNQLAVEGDLIVEDGAVVNATTGLELLDGGAVGGANGVIVTPVFNHLGGTLDPGDDELVASLDIHGSYQQTAAAEIRIDLTPNDCDAVVITGAASLAGPLVLTPMDDDPAPGAQFTVLTASDGITGGFAAVDAPFPAEVAVMGDDVIVTVGAPDVPGDLDGDGMVGPADLATMLGSWGVCPDCPADLDGDGAVGPADLATLLGNWG